MQQRGTMNLGDDFIAPACDEAITILFQDDAILFIDKPSGLLSLSGKNPLNKDSVHYRLLKQFPTATLAHRLDFGTSGIMVVALNKSVNCSLTKQFQNRTIKKTYTAILQGHVVSDHGVISIPIIKDVEHFPYQKVCYETGKNAVTDYTVLERMDSPCSTRVLFSPQTGRTHQLRIHSREIGHSILGCDLYGSRRVGESNDESSHEKSPRLLLHASTLVLAHPITGEEIVGESVCPF
jgi:tRNA pseudouridine32 synthase / 23S rRNA pseudouridine746 synthase